jgi:hypothetical protein
VVSGLVVGWFAASGAPQAVAPNRPQGQTMDLAKTERMDASATPEF